MQLKIKDYKKLLKIKIKELDEVKKLSETLKEKLLTKVKLK